MLGIPCENTLANKPVCRSNNFPPRPKSPTTDSDVREVIHACNARGVVAFGPQWSGGSDLGEAAVDGQFGAIPQHAERHHRAAHQCGGGAAIDLAWFADSSVDTADVLVGADGIGSGVRRQYLPHVRVVDTGKRMLMGATPLKNLNKSDRTPLVTLTRSAPTHDQSETLLREFIDREITGRLAAMLDAPDAALRAGMVNVQVLGIAVARYLVRIEPIASASVDELVTRFGPVVQHCLTDD
jgi:hypothetical protein